MRSFSPRRQQRLTSRLLGLGLWLVLWLVGTDCFSQEDRLIDQEPFDLITVTDEKGDHELKVFPVKITPRRVPKKPKPTDLIPLRLVEDVENRNFEVQWKDVKLLQFYEDMVLTEAEERVSRQKFDDAYPYYQFLLKNYPKTQGLEASIHAYWYLSAGTAFRAKRYDEALAVLEELLKVNPSYKQSENSPSLFRVLGEIVDKLIARYHEKKDYTSVRQLLSRITTAYPDAKEQPFYAKWKTQLSSAAEKKRDEASEFLDAKRYTAAYDATRLMLDLWPEVEGGIPLAKKLSEAYPVLVVGVTQIGNHPQVFRYDRWADKRTGRLTDRRLTESVGMSAEGGLYASPLGTIERTEDGRTLRFILKTNPPPKITAFDVASLLLSGTRTTDANFSPAWAEIFGDVRIAHPGLVEVTLRRSHVIPRALPAFPLVSLQLPATERALKSGCYEMHEAGDLLRFVLPVGAEANAGQPREIQERYYNDPQKALMDFERGKIDCMDRVQPIDLETLRAMPGVSVVKYGAPVIHALVPNMNRPWSKMRTMRRAVMYGTNREIILKKGILQEKEILGAQRVSGPFPAPFEANDTLSYAYDATIPPHTYEPFLALTLFDLAKREAKSQAELRKEPPPQFDKLVFGHPVAELPRMACKALAKQLEALGIPCQVVEVDGQVPMPPNIDFLYAELTIGEPVVDATRLFGSRGLFPADEPHVRLAVRRVEQASTWNEASQRLRELHRVVHEELTLLPLYQTPEYFSVRNNVKGFTPAPGTFYQNIENWRITPRVIGE